MFDIQGRYGTARVFAETVDPKAVSQAVLLLNMPYAEGARVRFMPDMHPGESCVIGTTMEIKDRPVCPNLVGCDIGCGMLAVRLAESEIDLPELDRAIRANVPTGKGRPSVHPDAAGLDPSFDADLPERAVRRAVSQLGTLGGGNHFIELDRCSDGLMLVVHSGSRSLGLAVLRYYMGKASRGRTANWPGEYVPDALAFLDGGLRDAYLHDAAEVQAYAAANRAAIASSVMSAMGLREKDRFDTVHNYVDVRNGILRKGAVSAGKGELCIIPLNMRDGSLVCRGKGNPDWNMSAPHGAGRLLSRADASARLDVREFEAAMAGIWSSSVSEATLDESPMAYKPAQEIIDAIGPTVDVLDHVKPIYNFKAGDRE